VQEGDFKDGIKKIQIALQIEIRERNRTSKDVENDFRPDFLRFLWDRWKKIDSGIWAQAVERLCLFHGKPCDMTASNFASALKEAREERDAAALRWRVRPEVEPPDFEKFYRNILVDPAASPSLRKVAEEWLEKKSGKRSLKEAAAGKGEKFRSKSEGYPSGSQGNPR
jgi:hypothetical protein